MKYTYNMQQGPCHSSKPHADTVNHRCSDIDAEVKRLKLENKLLREKYVSLIVENSTLQELVKRLEKGILSNGGWG